MESDWVVEEAEVGKKKGILIPVFLEEFGPPTGFGAIQGTDLSGWDGEAKDQLVIGPWWGKRAVVAWSEASVESDWVVEEAEVGKKKGILIPVFLEEFGPPTGFGAIQGTDLSGWDGEAKDQTFQQLVKGMERLLGSPPGRIQEEERRAKEETKGKVEEEERRPTEEQLEDLFPEFRETDSAKKQGTENIYVGGLPYSTTEEQLDDLFSEFGVVESAKVITHRDTGRSRGFGFVEMETSEEAQQAIASLNGVDFDGRTLTVNEAKPREDRSFGGGGSPGEKKAPEH